MARVLDSHWPLYIYTYIRLRVRRNEIRINHAAVWNILNNNVFIQISERAYHEYDFILFALLIVKRDPFIGCIAFEDEYFTWPGFGVLDRSEPVYNYLLV